ncbi:glutamate synthase subunit beta [Pseudonocardia endophytica]|uniref:Glutamate synthase (NADPH/NADH) small chain n=1 Tax=Pseudonocardia endophytica TaxID=401976 RepID=A0A4V2PHK1_PSEEN|nr:glutamate synthase subunit beta [Pseudonocardia endophytica]TCK21016.1 glutamate synthase (NADPH/NADH) small chain [Pseudonocardia endophytica]
MADPKGFMTTPRETPVRRPVDLRLMDWNEVYEDFPRATLEKQAGRCMNCGIPFCHQGCPLGNLIPEWNDLVWRHDWREAIERLHATNNFPEFTGTLCPAPCEAACVLAINDDAVTIKQVEIEIIDRAWDEGWVAPQPPRTKTGKKVAVVGSGPAGLAAAQQLTRVGHDVVVFERADRIGGLLRYGIPEFKMEKKRLDRRLEQMVAEGTHFRASVDVGTDVTAEQLCADFDAVVLSGGATAWRDIPADGRDAEGVYQAMEFLPWANHVQQGDIDAPEITAEGKDVVIIGGGDTGADCLGTSHRQGARSITQLEIMPTPPEHRTENMPWPTYPMVYRVSSAHEEGGDRIFSVNTTEFVKDADGKLAGMKIVEVKRGDNGFEPVDGTERDLPAQLVLLAMGFVGPEKGALLNDLAVDLDERGNVARDEQYMSSVDGVFVAGDMGRGQSLIVWAIAEGRAAAAGVDRYLTGRDVLPRPIEPTDRPIA